MKTPAGFTFSGVHAGIKPNRRDLALIYSASPCTAAGCFTANKAKAAPVLDAERRLPSADVRAVIINSGNANALTGPAGLEDVGTILEQTGKALGISANAVLSASTGVIGLRMPTGKITGALPNLVQNLRPEPEACAEAIMTTDTRIKTATCSLLIGGREVTLSGICKGSGMIAPEVATMIAVVVTDCAIQPPALATALRRSMTMSFNSITVDDDMSTNDVVFAMANGRAKNPPVADPGPDFDRFAAALTELCCELAREIAVKMCRNLDEDFEVLLLRDIRDLFDQKRADRLASAVIVDNLNLLPHGLWVDWRGKQDTDTPRPMTPGIMAKLLAPFGVRPATIWPLNRTADSKSSRGYHRSQFEDAWARYCQPGADTPTQPSKIMRLHRR